MPRYCQITGRDLDADEDYDEDRAIDAAIAEQALDTPNDHSDGSYYSYGDEG